MDVDAEPKQGATAGSSTNGGAAKPYPSSFLDTKSAESEIHHYAQTVRTLYYCGGAYVVSDQDPRWTQNLIYTPIFTHY